MNRRTFIKLTGITTITVLTIPAFSAPKRQKWISLVDQIPKPGQKVIMTNEDQIIGGKIGLDVKKNHLKTSLEYI